MSVHFDWVSKLSWPISRSWTVWTAPSKENTQSVQSPGLNRLIWDKWPNEVLMCSRSCPAAEQEAQSSREGLFQHFFCSTASSASTISTHARTHTHRHTYFFHICICTHLCVCSKVSVYVRVCVCVYSDVPARLIDVHRSSPVNSHRVVISAIWALGEIKVLGIYWGKKKTKTASLFPSHWGLLCAFQDWTQTGPVLLGCWQL